MSKQPPPAPTASAVGPCPTVFKIVGRPGTGSLPSTFAPPDHPQNFRNRCKIYSVHLHLGLYLYAKYQDPSQSGSSDILSTRLFLYKMPVSKKEGNSTENLPNCLVQNLISSLHLGLYYRPNIRILAKAVFKILCLQGYSYTKCLCPKKGNNSTENLRNRFKS